MDTLIAACGKNTNSSKNTERPRYLAYMLRLWQVGGEGEQAWRASLESPHDGERRGFASLDALFAFLEEQTQDPSSRPAQAPADPALDRQAVSNDMV